MSELESVKPQAVDTGKETVKEPVSSEFRDTKRSQPVVLRKHWAGPVFGGFTEPRLGLDFSRVPSHTDTVAESTENSVTSGRDIRASLIGDDSETQLKPGRMRKSEFLARLRPAVTRTVEEAIAGTGRTAQDCPYIRNWFGYYQRLDSAHLERAIHRYVPEAVTSTSAEGYIPYILQRVRHSAEEWARTGKFVGIPEGIPMGLPGLSAIGSGILSGISQLASGIGGLFFKTRNGGARENGDPHDIQRQLGDGRPLDNNAQSRMTSAFGRDFAHVRIHTDSTASGLSNRFNARAFTVGRHIAFAPGEYRPGTLMGDALIAHELAHVQQQNNGGGPVAKAGGTDNGYDRLENDADKTAGAVVASLWGYGKRILGNITTKTGTMVKSGLRLQRCDDDKFEENEKVVTPEKKSPPKQEKVPEKAKPPAQKETPEKEEEPGQENVTVPTQTPETIAANKAKEEAERRKRENEKIRKDIAAVKSLRIEEIQKARVKGLKKQLDKFVKSREKAIDAEIEKVTPLKKQPWAQKKLKALEKDRAKTLEQIIGTPDSKYINKAFRKDILEYHEKLASMKKTLTAAEKKWHSYDEYFGGTDVIDTLKKKGFTPAELKALIAQESEDLTIDDQEGDIAGIAQMNSKAVKEVGHDPADRLIPKKAIPIAAKVLIKKTEYLDKGFTDRNLSIPTGDEYKKFIYASYNAGQSTILVAAAKAKEMKRDETVWANIIRGGEKSPLYHGIKTKLPKLDTATKYKETTDYVERILRRLK